MPYLSLLGTDKETMQCGSTSWLRLRRRPPTSHGETITITSRRREKWRSESYDCYLDPVLLSGFYWPDELGHSGLVYT